MRKKTKKRFELESVMLELGELRRTPVILVQIVFSGSFIEGDITV